MADLEGSDVTLASRIPERTRGLRACLRCKLLKTAELWESGCENCGESGDYHSYTTPTFKGMIAMMQPQLSWVFRYQNSQIGGRAQVQGLYAVTVTGTVTEEQYEYE